MTEKLTRRQALRRGLWLTVGAAFVPAWARKLSEDMERAEPKPRVFMMSADYSQLELRALAYADWSLSGLSKRFSLDHTPRRYSESGRLLYDPGVRYRVSHQIHDEVILEEHPQGETLEAIRNRLTRFDSEDAAMFDMWNYMRMNGVKFDQKRFDEFLARRSRG